LGKESDAMRDSKRLLNIIFAGLAAAVIFLMTYYLKLPQALGYIHLGDAAIVAFSMFLTPTAAFASAAIGSSMADVLVPAYAIYTPFTFVIKGINALIVSSLSRKINSELAAAIGGVFMVLGYFVSEMLILPLLDKSFGLSVAISAVPGNCLQAISGVAVGSIVARLLKKSGIKRFE